LQVYYVVYAFQKTSFLDEMMLICVLGICWGFLFRRPLPSDDSGAVECLRFSAPCTLAQTADAEFYFNRFATPEETKGD